jgi:hypothetical protein
MQVVDENGKVLTESEVNGQTVLQAEHGMTYRVRLRVYRDTDWNLPVDKICASLYVDGLFAEGTCMTLEKPQNRNSFFLDTVFTGYRKNLHEKLAYIFCLPKTSTQPAVKVGTEHGGVLKVIVYRGVDTGRVQDRNGNWESTVPATTAETSEDVKLWNRPSIVTSPGKRIQSRLSETYGVWDHHEQLAILTLPYHSADAITFLQDFHNAQRGRESLAQALQESLPFPGPERPIDLTDGGTTLEVKTEYLRAQPVLVGATTPLLVDLTGEEDIDRNDGPFSKRPRTDV